MSNTTTTCNVFTKKCQNCTVTYRRISSNGKALRAFFEFNDCDNTIYLELPELRQLIGELEWVLRKPGDWGQVEKEIAENGK